MAPALGKQQVAAAAAAVATMCASTAFVPVLLPSQRTAGATSEVLRTAEAEVSVAASSGAPSTAAGFVAGALSAAAVVAVAKTKKKAARTAATAVQAFDKELGATLPFKYFDPLGLSKDGDAKAFRRRREAEIKNGRVAMLAAIGYIVPEYYRFPGFASPSENLKFSDIPNGIQALYKLPAEGWAQIFVFVGFLELFPMWQDKERAPGDFAGYGRLGVPGFGSKSDPTKNERGLNAELNNGRLAMLAISGMVAQNGLFGTTGAQMWLPGAAFENELGVQAPVGFWDPLGFANDGNVDTFRRRRAVELKHGRVSMLASIGYLVPEYYKWPGDIAPSQGLKFADIPHGLAAVTKVPTQGWLQIALFIGHFEGFFYRQDAKRPPGDFENVGFLGIWKNFIFNVDPPVIQDPAERAKKLSAELANGRLAMVAITAMVFQNGTVGATGPEMWLPKAFEGELGVQAPLGYFDPLGLTKNSDLETFRQYRNSEIKHGRVAMYATMGFILPEYYRLPGFLSPSGGLKFADMPNGIAAVGKVPIEGWLQILAFTGFFEFVVNQPINPAEPGNYGKGRLGITGSSITDPEARKRSLNSELANGRLAMLAIMGMIVQNGVFGTTGPAMWLPGGSAFESELGVQAPVGFWDPLGFTKTMSPESFRRRRQVELKHGRVAMLAALGYIVPEYFRFPGDLSPSLGLKFTDVPAGLAAVSQVPTSGWAQIISFLGFIELFVFTDDVTRAPGDFANAGFLGIPNGPSVPQASKAQKLSAELANGRLAMMAIIGMFFQDGLTGSAWGDWALYTDSPLRAFEKELGVQAPVGFWDPLGFSADGDVDNFRRRRAVELKHGRVSMLASIGYIVPEYFRWPGDIAPSQGLKFTDIPHGIAAITKVPVQGWLQIGLFIGHFEGFFYRQDAKRAPGDFENVGFLGIWKNFIFNVDPPVIQDPAERAKKLSAELANGRLAMVAITALVFQNGTVGATGAEMWLPKAFEAELGVQAPVGFFDPLGFAADGDIDTFRRRRAVELKHGRISMLASIGYIVPEYFKWPGEIAPSQGLKFADIPHGLAAVTKVPVQGWLQIALFIGHFEGFFFRQDAKRAPGDFENVGFLGIWKNFIFNVDPPVIKDPAERAKKLSAELANGRLAMVAITALVFQNGTVGSSGAAMWLPGN